MNWKDKKVFITGISGFVGPYLARYLYEEGATVFGFMRKRADWAKPKNLVERGIYENIELIEGELTNISSLASALDCSSPDVVFHFGAQSYIPRSFQNPTETVEANITGTENLLEAVRIKEYDPVIVFAGSSEEYGLVITSEKQYKDIKEKFGTIFPEPDIPEIPVKESNPLRPMSPYGVTKVAGDFLMRNYFYSYGLKTVVSRAFNHEGAGRGIHFVTSVITSQVMRLVFKETDKITIGNVNSFRDWSHVLDIVRGYCILAEKGEYGEVYNQGSMRTNSVLSYILLSLEKAGYTVEEIETVKNEKKVETPTERDASTIYGVPFEKTKIDRLMLENAVEFSLEDKGIFVSTDEGKILIEFDPKRFRASDVPILLSDAGKIKKLGFTIERTLGDIIKDQLNYYMKKENRQ